MNILVTGGAGYIGSHTIIELFEQGYTRIFSIDNYLNSKESNYEKIEKITGKTPEYNNIDLTDLESTRAFFKVNKIDAIIHFAALKSVPESVENSEVYYRNNTLTLLNLLSCMKEFDVKHIIFSSSCSVYGNPDQLPVNESTPFGVAESPYASTKQMGETILKDFCKTNVNFTAISLRYFNPVGAHSSGLIGENFSRRPNNLIPIITQTAAKIREKITVFGTDYNTDDGSCIRDYIHVIDIAKAHVKALDYQKQLNTTNNYDVFNLGTGRGTSVLEIIHSFEEISGKKLNYTLGDRRAGDVETIYSDNAKASSTLKWNASLSLEEMLKSAWKWQQSMEA
ncbi:MAG: UDP-glucose 4-epimerase GalE [Flavobacteriales bacterium]|nr:UDP-glucose 4-epimerase GalE [Flavobacteriales bacterium]